MVGAVSCKSRPSIVVLHAQQDTIAVRLEMLQQGMLAGAITTTGLLATEDETKLSFKVGGVIETVSVQENDFVKAGQVLATLKSTEVAAQVTQVQLALQKAERDYERTLNLYKDSVTTLEQLQNAKTGLDMAREAVATASFNQQYARIYAPASGFVVKKLMGSGEIAAPGMPVLVLNHVSGASQWVLRCGVTDSQWAATEVGNEASVTLDAFPGKVFKARVSNKALSADPQTGTFTLEIRVMLQGEKPAIGMFGRAQIIAARPSYVALIPYSALLEADGNVGYVFVTNDNVSVQKREIRLGKLYNDKVEVLSGLENMRYVVVAGSAFLSEASVIKVIQ